MARAPSPSGSPGRFVWILDGHNLIFASARWGRLHRTGDGQRAREELEEWAESFGRAAGVQPHVVFDGADTATRPARNLPNLRVSYAGPPAEADDLIRILANAELQARRSVCVVTSDLRTLGASLGDEIRLLSVPEFRKLHARVVRTPEKWLRSGSLDDVERHFLAGSPFASDREAADPERGPGDAAGPDEDEDPR